MYIHFGTRLVTLKTAPSPGMICPQCSTKGSLVFMVFSRYWHIYWLPMFPIGRTGGCQCGQCGTQWLHKDMNRAMRVEYDSLRGLSVPRIWEFSGLLLAGVLAGLIASYVENQPPDDDPREIGTPMVGDVYWLRTPHRNWSCMRIVRLSDDSVYVQPSALEVQKVLHVAKLNQEGTYSDDTVGYARTEIEEMYAQGTIYNVSRTETKKPPHP